MVLPLALKVGLGPGALLLTPRLDAFEDRASAYHGYHSSARASWGSVPLALRITSLMPGAMRCASPCGAGGSRMANFAPDGSSVYPKVTESQAAHCFWCYTSAHTCRPVAWLLLVKTGLCLRFRAIRNACADSSCPPQGLTRWCRLVTRSNCSRSLPSSPSGIDSRLMAWLATARVTALWAGCPWVLHLC